MFSADSLRLLRDSLQAGRPLAGPLDVQLLPTPRCNAACVFCPLHAIPAPLQKHTPRFHTYQHDFSGGLLDRLADDLYHLGGLRRLTITGGEPLLYPFLVPAVWQFLKSFPQADLTVVTNGIRLKSFATFFATAGLHHLTISINAGRPESYLKQNPKAHPQTFAEIEAGIRELMAERRRRQSPRPYVTLSVVLTAASAEDVSHLFELGRATGVDAVTFVPLMEIWLAGQSVNQNWRLSPDQLRRFHEELDKYSVQAQKEGFFLGYAGKKDDQGVMNHPSRFHETPCYAGYTFAAIFPNGDVRPCCHCEPILGNLQEKPFAEIWRGPLYQQMREQMLRLPQTKQELPGCFCRECGYAYENAEFHRLLNARPKESEAG